MAELWETVLIDDRLLCLGMLPPLPRRASMQAPSFILGISLQEFLAVDASMVIQWSLGPEPFEDALPRQMLQTTDYDERDRALWRDGRPTRALTCRGGAPTRATHPRHR